MYSYSPIKQVYIKNFRNLGEVTIDFKDSPIVSLIGENEQGKTSVVKAIAVCAMHATPRDQKDYIRDGTKGFGVAIELEDGTQVVRMKMATANSYRVTYPKGPDGNPIKPTWEAAKLSNDLPQAVQDVMGMIEEPETKEFLHIRTYEDQLLFVTTASSTNYKVMYNALKISQLVDAIKLGSKEANALKTSINQKEIQAETLDTQAKSLKIYDLEPLQNIRDRLKNEVAQLNKLDRALELKKKIEVQTREVGELSKLSSIPEISITLVMSLDKAYRVLDNLKELGSMYRTYSLADSLEEIDLNSYYNIYNARVRYESLKNSEEQSRNYIAVNSLSEININEVSNLQRAIALQRKIEADTNKLQTLNISRAADVQDSDLTVYNRTYKALGLMQRNKQLEDAKVQIDNYCDAVIKWMKDIGVATETCPKCGETIVIDLDKLEKS